MSVSFTPGPWVLGNTSHHETMIIGRGGKGDYVCHVQFEQIGGGAIASAMEPARRANARLIAAAPELYAACQYIVDAAENGDEMTAVEMATAALAKARGEV